jgi:hypothetical protein
MLGFSALLDGMHPSAADLKFLQQSPQNRPGASNGGTGAKNSFWSLLTLSPDMDYIHITLFHPRAYS